jgi:hypothetical protein
MSASPEEISAGQKAYQGLRAYQRFKTSQQSKLSVFLNVVTGLFLFVEILAYGYAGKYWIVATAVISLVLILRALRSMKETNRKNFELLKRLKAKYGPEIYDAIAKEPDSIQYRLFQKSYPPERQPPSVELP